MQAVPFTLVRSLILCSILGRNVVDMSASTQHLLHNYREGDTWLALSENPLTQSALSSWVSVPSCGAVVTFTGVVRDHSEGRPDVHTLDYEAYEAQVIPKLSEVAEAARRKWETIGRIAMIHRVGTLHVGDLAVVVSVSTPHRSECFAAAAFCIDTLKHTVPIWKREISPAGAEWVRCDHEGATHKVLG
jgi:molybdopterin synthase catalytic subunit